MKRVEFIEWGIIAVSLIFGYKFFEAVFGLFVQIIYQFDRHDLVEGLIRYLLVIVIYAVGFILLIRNSRKAALYLNGPVTDDALPFRINKQSLLQVILISICAATVLSSIAEILLYIFELFRKDVGGRGVYDKDNYTPNSYFFKQEAIKAIVAVVVICFSKDIAGWFIRRNEPEELVLESNPETENDVHQ
jgi:hypothetical protein